MEAPNPTRLVTTSNSITEGRKLATYRPFANTSELHIVKKSPNKRIIQYMHAYMVGRFLGRWLTENQAILTLVQVQLHLQSNWCCVPLSSHSGRKPTHQEITSADVLAGRKWRRILNGLKPVLLGVKNYFEPLIWLNVFMLKFVTQVKFLAVEIIVCTWQFKVPLRKVHRKKKIKKN